MRLQLPGPVRTLALSPAPGDTCGHCCGVTGGQLLAHNRKETLAGWRL